MQKEVLSYSSPSIRRIKTITNREIIPKILVHTTIWPARWPSPPISVDIRSTSMSMPLLWKAAARSLPALRAS